MQTSSHHQHQTSSAVVDPLHSSPIHGMRFSWYLSLFFLLSVRNLLNILTLFASSVYERASPFYLTSLITFSSAHSLLISINNYWTHVTTFLSRSLSHSLFNHHKFPNNKRASPLLPSPVHNYAFVSLQHQCINIIYPSFFHNNALDSSNVTMNATQVCVCIKPTNYFSSLMITCAEK